MRFISTRGGSPPVTASQAIVNGLAPDGGLYVPERFPVLGKDLFNPDLPYHEFAAGIIQPFFEGDPLYEQIPEICRSAFDFDVPLTWLTEKEAVLELFHGPTAAFKDFGARFLASVLEILQEKADSLLTILVATSGDTGSAVASAFHLKKGIQVKVLFPKGRVSFRQEKQLTCWNENIQSYSVEGNFDDCQRMVKEAFQDSELAKEWRLSSANSINLGRLLPQMVYYIYGAAQYHDKRGVYPSYVIPSGNVGNSVGAYWSRESGAPVKIASLAVNENRTIPDYLESGTYTPRDSVQTLANAMDVGNPSNMERLLYLFKDFKTFKKNVCASSVSDDEIRETIRSSYGAYSYILCPHTAAGEYVREKFFAGKNTVVVSTAHPAKFEQVVEPEIGVHVPVPASLKEMLESESCFTEIKTDFNELFHD